MQRLSEGVVEHQRTSLADIQSYTEHGRSMFQSILVFERITRPRTIVRANFNFKKRRCVKAPKTSLVYLSTQQAQNWNSPLSLTRSNIPAITLTFLQQITTLSSQKNSSLVQTMRVFAMYQPIVLDTLVDAGNATAASAHKEWQDTRPCHHAFSEKSCAIS